MIGSVCSRAPQRGCVPIHRICGRAVLSQEQCRDGKDDGCDEDQALQRCGQGLRRDDGAAPPGCHRHGRSRAELWTRRTAAPPRPGNHRHSAGGDRRDAARSPQPVLSILAIDRSAIFEQHAPAVVSLDAYAVCLCHRRPHMKRRFFTILLATTALVLALLTTTTLVTTPSAWAGQVPFGTATSPDIPVSHRDRVYTADQWSNTVTVTDPVDNKLLGVIRLGDPTPANLSPLYYGQVLVHGMGFSPDHRTLLVVSIASNSVAFIDTATNAVKHITYVGRSPHEAFFTQDGKEVWVTVRGENYVSVINPVTYREKTRIIVPNGPGMTIFSPDGQYGYVCSSFMPGPLGTMMR